MTEVNAKLMTVIGAIKQSIETSGSPGLSVNNHPNAFFLNVIGAIDLAKAAELVLARLEAYEENLKAKFEADVRGLYGLSHKKTAGSSGSRLPAMPGAVPICRQSRPCRRIDCRF